MQGDWGQRIEVDGSHGHSHVPTARLPDTTAPLHLSPGPSRRGRSTSPGEPHAQIPSEVKPSPGGMLHWRLGEHTEKPRRGSPVEESKHPPVTTSAVAMIRLLRRVVVARCRIQSSPTIASRKHLMPPGGLDIRTLARAGTPPAQLDPAATCPRQHQHQHVQHWHALELLPQGQDKHIATLLSLGSSFQARTEPNSKIHGGIHRGPRQERIPERCRLSPRRPGAEGPSHARATLACRDNAGEPRAPRTSHPSTRRTYHRAPSPSQLRRAQPLSHSVHPLRIPPLLKPNGSSSHRTHPPFQSAQATQGINQSAISTSSIQTRFQYVSLFAVAGGITYSLQPPTTHANVFGVISSPLVTRSDHLGVFPANARNSIPVRASRLLI